MKTKPKLAAAAVMLAAFIPSGRASHPAGCHPLAGRIVRAWPGYTPRDIRVLPLFPFSEMPRPTAPFLALRTTQDAAPRVALVDVRPREQTVSITITIPASLARELLASGAIKLPGGKP